MRVSYRVAVRYDSILYDMMSCIVLCVRPDASAFGALTLLVGRQEEHLACKN